MPYWIEDIELLLKNESPKEEIIKHCFQIYHEQIYLYIISYFNDSYKIGTYLDIIGLIQKAK